MTEPIVQQWHLVAFMLATLLALIAFAAWEWWKTWRASRVLEDERRLARGMGLAKRFGLLPRDDVQ